MTTQVIDEKFLVKLRDRGLAARREVLNNSYFGTKPEGRLKNFADSIEGGLGGDVGLFLGMLEPDVVNDMVRHIWNYRSKLGRIHRLSGDEFDEGPMDEGAAMLDKLLRSGGPIMIPLDDSQQAKLDQLTAANNQLAEKLGATQKALDESVAELQAVHQRVDELKTENAKLQSDSNIENASIRSLMENEGTLVSLINAVVDQVDAWEGAYLDSPENLDSLVARVRRLIDKYGSLNIDYNEVSTERGRIAQSCGVLHEQITIALRQRDEWRGELDLSEKALEELSESVDVLGAYLNHPHAASESRLETIKSAMSALEDRDETIEALHRALRSAQGQPRRVGIPLVSEN